MTRSDLSRLANWRRGPHGVWNKSTVIDVYFGWHKRGSHDGRVGNIGLGGYAAEVRIYGVGLVGPYTRLVGHGNQLGRCGIRLIVHKIKVTGHNSWLHGT